MIAYLKGKLAHKDPTHIIVECNGVGYFVRISLNTYEQLGNSESVLVHTHMVVKEDAQDLYGFAETSEKILFRQLISISGVGGNTAMTILSGIQPKELFRIIETEDVNSLKKVKGIGAKTAGRIILELKGKLVTDGDMADASPMGKVREEALAALLALGLTKAIAEKRVETIVKKAGDAATVELIIREALRAG